MAGDTSNRLYSLKMGAVKFSSFAFALFIIIYMLQATMIETQRSSPCHRICKYVEAFQQANCEERQLETVPIECNAASYLSLRYNQITRIEPGIFRGFPFLRYLILSNNNISHIEANTFIGAPELKSIKLLYNNLQTLDRNALNGTENRLRNIYLSRNSLRVIENGTFQVASRLEVIDLQSNQLTHLSSDVFKDLKHLERLFLGMNKLAYLPDNIFKDLTSLVYLDLSNNSLSSLSNDLFAHMDQLRTVDASGNKLVNIGNILSLPHIRLDLRWNHLSQLGNVSLEILNENVEILFLEGNPLDCSCSIEPFRLWYQQLSMMNAKDVKIDNPACSGPNELVNRTINLLNGSLCMPVRSTETSMNSPDYSPTNTATGATDPLNSSVTKSSEKCKANSQINIIVSVVVAVAIVIIVTLLSIVIMVLLLKKCAKNSHRNEDCERNDPEVSDVIPEEGENTPLTGTPHSQVHPRSGINLTPEHEAMKEEGSNPKCNNDVVDAAMLQKNPGGTPIGEISIKEDNNRRTKKNLMTKFNSANQTKTSLA